MPPNTHRSQGDSSSMQPQAAPAPAADEPVLVPLPSAAAAAADEADFIELLIASERVLRWLEQAQAGPPLKRRQAVLQLKAAVMEKTAYAEEARKAGAVDVMVGVLSKTDDEAVLDAAAAIITACSGSMAAGGKAMDYSYGDVTVRIQEGMLGDGLGARVWTVAHVMCRELVEAPGLVRGRRVLEIGSGCGVCGIAAAKLGAESVILTDCEEPVLRNLRACVHLNTGTDGEAAAGGGDGGCSGSGSGSGSGGASCSVTGSCSTRTGRMDIDDDAALFDDAEEVDDFDDLLADLVGGGGGTAKAAAAGPGSAAARHAWDAGTMSVRLLDWFESQRWLAAGGRRRSIGGGGGGSGAATGRRSCEGAATGRRSCEGAGWRNVEGAAGGPGGSSEDVPPAVPPEERFECIIGTDVVYEPAHARLVPAVVRHRLKPGGQCLLCCAVRDLALFRTLASECARHGLRYRQKAVRPVLGYHSIAGREGDYEGGFALMAIDHEDAPGTEWHRSDFAAPAWRSEA